MIRLLKIEWLKLRHYRPFWVLMGMYLVMSVTICSGLMLFMQYLKNQGADFKGFSPTMLPLYDFPDVWHNLTFIASQIKIILAFIVVMSIYNEINYRIVRQNVIDGLSKLEWLGSKLFFIGAIAGGAALLVFLNGLLMGLIYSHPDAIQYMFTNVSFIFAYFIDVFTYLTFAMMLTLLFRRAGIVIVGLLMYTMMFEPIVSTQFYYNPYFENFTWLPDFFPVQSLRNLIMFPFKRYLFMEIQPHVGFRQVCIALGWLATNFGLSYLLLTKRDI